MFDKKAKEVTPIEYDDIIGIGHKFGYFIFKKHGKVAFANILYGGLRFSKYYDELTELDDFNLTYKFKENGKYGLVDMNADFREVSPASFDDIKHDRTGSAYYYVKQNGKWAVYDTFHKQCITGYIYDDIKRLDNGFNDIQGLKNNTWEEIKKR